MRQNRAPQFEETYLSHLLINHLAVRRKHDRERTTGTPFIVKSLLQGVIVIRGELEIANARIVLFEELLHWRLER